MKTNRYSGTVLIVALALLIAGCAAEPGVSPNTISLASPSPVASPATTPVSKVVPVTLPVLDALFSDEAFKTGLKAKVQLTDEQVAQLQKIASDEVARLRELNVEEQAEDSEQSINAREQAANAIRAAIGSEKAESLFSFAHDYWVAGNEGLTPGASPEKVALNAVPTDTRIVVNIPAYRMDVFKEGSLVKSYKIGIGYPEFPLPTGLRKAQTIIFNPTWTPPDEPWVAKMKNVAVGEKVPAGSKLNPLGPIKIPIGLPSLIHGGKSPAKLGTFASHGCVGLTTPQVTDFSKLLAQVAGGELSDATLQANMKDKTQTKTIKLANQVPVELRYETIVVEDGKLHIYRDVYDQATNTEENLNAVLQANGISLADLTDAERTQVLEALNAMSRHPGKLASTSPSPAASPVASASPEKPEKKLAPVAKKPIGKNQKEVVIELAALKGKGYPAAVNFDTGSGKPSALAMAKPALSKTP